MKKKVESSFFSNHKKAFVLGSILIIVIVAAILIFVNNQKVSQGDSNFAQDSKYTENFDDTQTSSVGGGSSYSSGSSGSGGTSSGGSSGESSTTSSSNTSEGNTSSSSVILEDTEFPYIVSLENNKIIDLNYRGMPYSLKVWWDYDDDPERIILQGIKSLLTSRGRAIPKVYHEYGEDSSEYLEVGKINFFDTDDNGLGDLKIRVLFSPNYADPMSSFRIKIYDVTNVEICSDGIDNDGNGLIDCQEPDCNGALGLIELPADPSIDSLRLCELGREMSCEGGFDNDGDGLVDVDELDCLGFSCGLVDGVWSYVIWSNLPEELAAASSYPARRGCCPSYSCVNLDGDCIEYDTYYETASGNSYYICGDGNNWDRCGPTSAGTEVNKHPGDLSDGGSFICIRIPATQPVYGWSFAG